MQLSLPGPTPRYRAPLEKMRKVYEAESLIDAQLVLDMLDNVDIPAILVNGNLSGGLGELPVSPPEIWIKRDHDAERACRIVRKFDVTEPPSGEISCGNCGEKNPESFEICWMCHAVLLPNSPSNP